MNESAQEGKNKIYLLYVNQGDISVLNQFDLGRDHKWSGAKVKIQKISEICHI